jgi:hypothetical protein
LELNLVQKVVRGVVFLQTHAKAVRELLNEYDYHTGTKAGRDFLNAIQSIGRQADALIEHSTFMMELRALGTISENKVEPLKTDRRVTSAKPLV